MVRHINYKSIKDLPPMVVSMGSMLVNKTGGWRTQRPVIDYELCTSCMICWKFCPEACISIKDGRPEIDLDYCKGCGICAEECPKKAIGLELEGK